MLYLDKKTLLKALLPRALGWLVLMAVLVIGPAVFALTAQPRAEAQQAAQPSMQDQRARTRALQDIASERHQIREVMQRQERRCR